MENNQAILIYGFSHQDVEIIDRLIKINDVSKSIVVEKNMVNMTIQDILDGLNLKVFNDIDIAEEKIILFNNFTDKDLNKLITLFKENLKESPIFAVVTPTSIEWTFKCLIEHLIEEREWFKSQNVK